MKRIFKYDYSNKFRNICLVLFIIGAIFSAYAFVTSILFGALVLLLISIFLIASVCYSRKGIWINNKNRTVKIIDDRSSTIPLKKIRKAYITEIKKPNKGKMGLMSIVHLGREESEFFDFIYNHGKVYYIVFEINDFDESGHFISYTYRSYFGWMYREKNQKKAEKVEKRLYASVSYLNSVIKMANECF